MIDDAELARLQRLDELVSLWASAHRATWPHSTMTEDRGDPEYVTTAEYQAIERRLLAAAKR